MPVTLRDCMLAADAYAGVPDQDSPWKFPHPESEARRLLRETINAYVWRLAKEGPYNPLNTAPPLYLKMPPGWPG